MRAGPLLLDVNALLALAWPNHQFHNAIVERLEQRPVPQWATCALTQLGFVRLSSNPKIVEVRKTPAEADVFRKLLGHQQVTDAYLLGVAEANGATLLTLDRRIVPAGTTHAHIEVVE